MSPTHTLLVNLLTQNVDTTQKVSIVDFGCGAGDLIPYLQEKIHIKSYIGLDVNFDSIYSAKKIYPHFSFSGIKGENSYNLGATNSQDAIFLVGVLQYMTNKEIAFLVTQMHRVLKPGGLILLSTTTDSFVYRAINLYHFFLPHRYFSSKVLEKVLIRLGFSIETSTKKGLFVAPLFSSLLSFFFDALDKVLFRTKGTLGPVGKCSRRCVAPLIAFEYTLPISFGYTTCIVARKR